MYRNSHTPSARQVPWRTSIRLTATLFFFLAGTLIASASTTFTKSSIATAIQPTGIASADFNGDGLTDIVTSSPSEDVIAVHYGKGGGAFTVPSKFAAPFNIYRALAADVTGDHKPDVICLRGDFDNFRVVVFVNDGTGNFGAPKAVAITFQPTDFTSGDFNRDGKQDIAVVGITSPKVFLMLGTSTGVLKATSYSVPNANGLRSVDAGDFNLDGKLDLAVLNCCNGIGGSSKPMTLLTLKGDGAGHFVSTTAAFRFTGSGQFVRSGKDFNGRGGSDILVTFSANADIGGGKEEGVALLLSNQNMTFRFARAYAVTGVTSKPHWADFDKDGILDVVATEIDQAATFPNEKSYVKVWFLNSTTSVRSASKLLISDPGFSYGVEPFRISTSGGSNHIAAIDQSSILYIYKNSK